MRRSVSLEHTDITAYVQCAVCAGFCARVTVTHTMIASRSVRITASCHGEVDQIEIPAEQIELGIFPILAFRKQRNELDRLTAEDAALAALGWRDPEAARLEAEDAALEALGI